MLRLRQLKAQVCRLSGTDHQLHRNCNNAYQRLYRKLVRIRQWGITPKPTALHVLLCHMAVGLCKSNIFALSSVTVFFSRFYTSRQQDYTLLMGCLLRKHPKLNQVIKAIRQIMYDVWVKLTGSRVDVIFEVWVALHVDVCSRHKNDGHTSSVPEYSKIGHNICRMR